MWAGASLLGRRGLRRAGAARADGRVSAGRGRVRGVAVRLGLRPALLPQLGLLVRVESREHEELLAPRQDRAQVLELVVEQEALLQLLRRRQRLFEQLLELAERNSLHLGQVVVAVLARDADG